MKKLILLSAATLFSLSVMMTSCKKNDAGAEDGTEYKVHAEDQSLVADQGDEVATDAENMTENVLSMSGNTPAGFFTPPCNATVTYDTLNAIKRMTITYNGLNCQGTRSRNGVVTLSLPAGVQWKNAGAQLTVNIQNLVITRVIDNKSITINGSKIITNVSGGLLRNLATVGTIEHTITSSGMNITFNNGAQRSWQIAKRRVFTYNNGIVISTTGTHSEGAVSGIAEWGTNRFGNSFATAILTPMIIRQDCNFRLTGGQIQHTKLIRTVNVTFGLDANGNPTGCPGNGNYYMKVIWTNAAGNSATFILPY